MKFTHPISNSLYRAFRKRPNQRTSQKVELQFEKLEPRQMLVGDLVFQANFEDVNVPPGEYAFFAQVSGLTATGSPVEVQNNHPAVGPASEGHNLLELDGTNGVFVEIENVPSDGLLLQGDYSPRRGYDKVQNEIEVLWNGSLIATLAENGKGNRSTEFERFEFTLPPAPGQTTGRLEFRSTTENDDLAVGGLLDDIKVFEFDSVDDQPPSLNPVSDQTVNEGQSLSIQFSASDPDSDQSQLRYSLDRAPVGATLNSLTGEFQWTPNSSAGGLKFPVDFRVTDESGLSDTGTFRITVNDVVDNQAPKLQAIPDQTIDEGQELVVQVVATDADSSQSQLRYSTMRAPVGATLDPVTGEFKWTPNAFAGGLRFPVDVVVTDQTGLTDTLTFRINVNDVVASQPPQLQVPSEQTIDEGQTLTVQVSATDPDSTQSQLRFSTVRIPVGSTLDPVTGIFNWTPNSFAGGMRFPVDVVVTDQTGLTDAKTFWVNVDDVNASQPPQLQVPGEQSIDELQTLTVQVSATDPDSRLSQLRFSTVRIPFGSTLDPVTGVFTWTPNSFAGGLRFPVDVVVTDQTGLTDAETFWVNVNDVNASQPPQLQVPSEQTIVELQTLTVQVTATDPDSDQHQLRFSTVRTPFGSALDPDTGVFTWTPNRFAGALRFPVDVMVTDQTGLTDAKTFWVNVENLDAAPVLATIPDQTVAQQTLLNFTASATDADRPHETLTFALSGSVPNGASIDPVSGLFAWTPMTDSAAGIYTFNVVVDDGNGNQDSQAVNINVTAVGDEIVLVEGNRFETEAERLISIARGTKQLSFNYAAFFDDADVDFINDAFEVALLDADGNSLVHTFADQRDAYFNLTEGELSALGANTQVDGSTVKVDLSHIAANTTARLVFRLVNNDADTQSRIRITGLETTDVMLGTPIGVNFGSQPEETSVEIDFAALTDVTGSLQIEYGVSSFDAESAILFANVQATNLANHPIDGPFVLVVHSISDPSVFLVGAAGVTLGGDRYYLLNDSTGLGTIASGDTTLAETLEFYNPGGVQFSYELSILAQPNTNPEFVTRPNREGETGVAYAYDANATDADDDKLTYKLMAAPAGLTVDSETGLIAWTPEMEDLGTHSVIIEVADGRGGEDSQQFEIEIVEDRPNRPPVIISTPVVEAVISPEPPAADDPSYQYPVVAIDADVDPIAYELTESPAGMQIDASTGLIGWNPSGAQIGLHRVVVAASDGRGGVATQEYQLRVLADSTNTNPVIISDPVDDLFVPGFSNPTFGSVSPQRISLDLDNGETFEGTVSITLPESAARFADVVLAVDESASMGGDQAWVAEMIPLLDAALVAEGIGATSENPNRFAIIGFGGGRDLITVGHFLNSQAKTKYTLYGPDNVVLAEGLFNDVLPDELLNLDLPSNGRYVLVVEAQDVTDLVSGIEIGVEGQTGNAIRFEDLSLNTIVEDVIAIPGQKVIYNFSLSGDTLIYFDSLAKDVRVQWTLSGPSGTIAENINFNVSINTTLLAYDAPAGDYQLTIDSNVDVSADYKFQILDLNAARTITSGETVFGEFELKAETFAYQFNADAGQTFEFAHSTTGVHPTSRWRLLNETGNEILTEYIGFNQPKVTLESSGVYYLLMESHLSPFEGISQLRTPSIFDFVATISDSASPIEVVFGETIGGEIVYVSQFVDYSFSLDQRSLIYLDSLVDSGISWTLTGPRGTEVNNLRFRESDSFNNVDPVLDLVAGEYNLRINSNTAVGDFEFRIMDLASATEITPGAAFDGELTIANQTDAYRFNANKGDEFYFDVEAASDSGNTQYKLIDPIGQVVFISNGLNDRMITTIPSSGTYTLLVEGRIRNEDADTYTINVSPVVESTVVMTVGSQVNGTLAAPGGRAVYTFDVVGDALLYFDSLTNDPNIVWSLAGPAGNEIELRKFTQSDSRDVTSAAIPVRAGNYQLMVQASADAIGDFSFVLQNLLAVGATTPITPNPGSANTTVNVAGTIATNETQLYRFNAQPGDEFSFDGSATGSVNAYYRVVDSFGSEIVADNRVDSDRNNQDFVAGGVYYLLVEGRFDNDAASEYSLDINWIQNNGATVLTGSPLAINTTVDGDLAADGQVDQFIFTLTERTLLYMDSLTNSGSIRWNLRGPAGTAVSSRAFNATDSFNNANPVGEFVAGEYQLEVYASSGTPGAYGFRMVDLASAIAITPGTAFDDVLDPANETNLYRFDAAAGDQFFFDVETVSDVTNTQHKLVDPFGRVVFISNRMYDTDIQTVEFDGTYTLLVEGWRGNMDLDTYTMNVHKLDPTSSGLTVGTPITGSIDFPGNVAKYTFSLADRQQIVFDANTNNSSLNWTLEGPHKTVVDSRRFDRSDSANFNNSVLDLEAGDYQLTIGGLGDATGPFGFALLNLADATAISVGDVIQETLEISNSSKAFRFDAQAGDIVYFNGLGNDSNFDQAPYWRLVDSFGIQLFNQAFSNDFGPVTLVGGTYTLLVEGRINDTGANGEFSFELIPLGNEINPVAPTAMAIGEVVSSETSTIYETDRYSFSLSEPTEIYFDSFTRDSTLVWSLQTNGRTLVDSRRFDFSDANSLISPTTKLEAGDYVLSVFSTQAEAYSFRLIDLADATNIAIEDVVNGDFAIPAETDIYRFVAAKGEKIFIDVLESSTPNAAIFRIVDELGNVVTNSSTITDQDPFEIPADGDYWLLVESLISQTVEQSYEFRLYSTTTSEFEITVGDLIAGNLAAPGDTFEYKFELSEDALVTFDSLSSRRDIVWSLASGASVIAGRDFANSDGSAAHSTLDLTAGSYTLTVDGKLDATGDFAFRLHNLFEATVIVFGATVAGDFATPNETDTYQFAGTAGQKLLFDVESDAGTGFSQVRIFDRLGNLILDGSSLIDREVIELELTGTYYVLLEARINNTDADPYEFNLREILIRDEGAIALSTAVNDVIAVPGEQVTFSFEVTDDLLIHFDSLANNAQINWTLEGPRGTEYSNIRFDRSDSTNVSNTSTPLPAFELREGSYTLTVDGTNGTVGDFGFNLINLSDETQSTLVSPITGTPVAVSGTQVNSSETQVFRFDAVAGDQFSFDSTIGESSSYYRLLDSFGTQVFIKRSNLDQGTVTLPLTGTYFLLVEGNISNTTVDTFSIDVLKEGNTPVVGFSGSTLTLGITQNGDLNTAGQVDPYTFTLTDRSLLYMDMLAPNTSAVRWNLIGPRGVEVSNRTFTGTDSLNNSDPVLDLIAGDYQLEILTSSGTPGAYGFTLHDLVDAASVVPGASFSGELTVASETDLYNFEAVAGQQFFFDVESASDVNGTDYKLIDPYGQVVLDSNRLRDHEVVTIPRDGTYALLVEGAKGNSGVDTYTMNIVPFVETPKTLLTTGINNASINTVGEQLVYDFSLTEDRLLYVDPLNAPANVTWTLMGELYKYVDAKQFNQGIEFVELSAGDYTITVDGVGDYLGDTSLIIFATSHANQLKNDGSITSGVLDSANVVQVFEFDGTAGEHFALLPDFNMQFTDSATAAATAGNYIASRDPEDGYSGLDAAIRADVFREGAAINYILVTDEDRDVAEDNVTFETLFRTITAQSALLNMVTTAQFRDDTNTRAIGVDSEGTAYIADGAGGFTVGTGGYTTTSNVSFQQDYIDLAWALDGANWDLGLVRAGGLSAESFTNAFIDVKVEEILEQTALRLISSNLEAEFEVTNPTGGVYTDVVPGATYDFEVRVGNNGEPISYDLLFMQGQTVGSIPVFIVSPYEYDARAVDADGDTLTWSLVSGPGRLMIDSETGALSWTAEGVFFGEHEITIRVEDGRGGFDEQSFVLDVNGGEPASISGLVFEGEGSQIAAGTTVVHPYLSVQDSPFVGAASFVFEDFEDGTLDLPGVTLSAGAPYTGGIVDSVDGDDGVIDGSGSQGWSWFATSGSQGIAISFDESLIGELPKQAGVAWTDGAGEITFRAFDGFGNLIEEVFSSNAGAVTELAGETEEDTFFGAESRNGISYIFISNTAGGIEIDHVQYSLDEVLPLVETPWTVYLDQNRNGLLDEGEVATETNDFGRFSFENLSTGTYVVAQQPKAGWLQTEPSARTHDVSIDQGEDLRDLLFGNREVPIFNTDPSFTSNPTLSVVAGEAYSYIPTIEELDGDTLSFDLPLAPAGMAVHPDNGSIRWTPSLDQIGSQNVLLRVRDSHGGFDLQYFQVEVVEPNSAPVITSTAPLGPAGVSLPYTYDVNAVDAQEDAITFSLDVAPVGMTIDSATGVIHWIPGSGQVGTHSISVVALDARGLSSEQSFELAVEMNPANVDPVFLSEPPIEVRLGDMYLYLVQTVDQNGDPTTLTLVEAPAGMTLDANGLVSWTPGPNQLGEHTVRLTVDDGRGGTASQEFTLEVKTQPVNFPPEITSIPLTAAIAEEAYSFQATATDRNFDTLVWTLEAAPMGMTIDALTGQINWHPAIENIGSHSVTVQVTDTYGAFSQLVYTLRVRAVNTPPVILSAPPTTGAVGSTYLYQVGAEDVDQDRLTFSLANAPAGMSIDAQTGLLQWTPTTGQDGSADVGITVTDSIGASVSQNYTIQVADGQPNQLPVITSIPGFFATVGATYTYQITAADPDGDVLTYTLLSSQNGMTVDSVTGLLQWTPTADDLGTSLVEIVARDPSLGGSIQQFSLTVLAANNAPVISSTPPTMLASGQPFRYDVLATDADGEFLRYELVSGPEGMVIDGLGRMFWIPMVSQIGENSVEITVTDPRGAFATQAFNLTVAADTVAPRVVVNLSDNPVDVGSMIDISVQAIDNVGVETLLLTVDGVAVPLDSNGTARIQLDTVGAFTALATATDAAGNSATDSVDIFVADPNDVDGPVISIAAPGDGDSITAPTAVIGSVMDDTLVSYRLLLGDFKTRNFKEIANGTENVDNDVLGMLDPTLLQNGSYLLRLEAFDAGGNGSVIEQAVEITGELKLGNFQLAFTDMIIPVAGIPIQITRVYDTLQAQEQGDFGYGWRLEYRNTNLQVSLDPTGLENYGIYPAFREGVRVYLNVPGLGRQGFTFTPEYKVLPGFGNNLVLARPKFTSDFGNKTTLSVPTNGYLTVNEFGELSASGAIPYNPASPDFGGVYVLTTDEGVTYRINGGDGKLDSATDRNGNRISFTASGVLTDNGVGLVFEQDSAGRISKIIDPNGSSVQYQYESGRLANSIDRKGNTTHYLYESDQPNFLTEVIDPLGRTGLRTVYGPDGRLQNQSEDLNGASIALEQLLENGSTIVRLADGSEQILRYNEAGQVVELIDELGNTTHREYDELGMSREIDAVGNETRFIRNSRGDIIQRISADGSSEFFSYDSKGRLTSTSNQLGDTTTFEYDEKGNLIKIEEGGLVTRQVFDDEGNVIRREFPDGSSDSFTFDSRGFLHKQTIDEREIVFGRDANGNETSQSTTVTENGTTETLTLTKQLDANGNPISIVDSAGVETQQVFDAFNNVVSITNSTGQVVQLNRDGRPQLQGVTYANGTSGEYKYNERNFLTESISPTGEVTKFVYDAAGNNVARIYSDETPGTDDDNPRDTFEYDGLRRVVAQTNAAGERSEFAYNSRGQVVTQSNGLGESTWFEYDAAGNLVKQTDSLGAETRFRRDNRGNLVETTFPDGSTELMSYDSANRVIRIEDAVGSITRFEYDTAGNLKTVIDALGNITRYETDAFGNLRTSIAADGAVSEFEFDRRSAPIGTELADGSTVERTFRADGRVASEINLAGEETTFTYDDKGRLSVITYFDGSIEQFSYDGPGRVTGVADVNGSTIREFNSRGFLTRFVSPNGAEVRYEYDDLDRRTAVITDSVRTEYAHDLAGRIVSVSENGSTIATNSYDARGNLIATTFGNGVRELKSYDERSRLTNVRIVNVDGDVLRTSEFEYDHVGQILSETEGTNRFEYLYDELGQLTSWRRLESGTTVEASTLEYDQVGNLVKRVTDGVESLFSYDVLGQLVEEIENGQATQFEYDGNGNLISASQGADTLYRYTWDARNRLTSVEVFESGGQTTTTTYEYDFSGLLIRRVQSGVETTYSWDRSQNIPVIISATEAGETEYFFHSDRVLGRTTSNGDQFFYHADASQNVRAQSGPDQSLVYEADYSPFGQILNEEFTATYEDAFADFEFAGELFDDASGLTYLRQRHLDSDLQRFVSRDSFAGEARMPITQQPYQYALNSPLVFSDPTGEFAMPTLAELQVAGTIAATIGTIGVVQVLSNRAFAGGTNNFSGVLGSVEASTPSVGVSLGIAYLLGGFGSEESFTNSDDQYSVALGTGVGFTISAGLNASLFPFGASFGSASVDLPITPLTHALRGTSLSGAYVQLDLGYQTITGESILSPLIIGFAYGSAAGDSIGTNFGAGVTATFGVYLSFSVAVDQGKAHGVRNFGAGFDFPTLTDAISAIRRSI